MEFNEEQIKELLHIAKHAPQSYVRTKALAIWNIASGRSQTEVAQFMVVSRVSINQWIKNYLSQGITGLVVKKGRGPKEKVNKQEIESYMRQSPRQFGLEQTRWTLQSLGEKVSSLKGFTTSGVYRALVRLGYRYKRGQPNVHSPDPLYEEKKGLWIRPSERLESIRER